jgi:hypothetical protein
MHICKFIYCAYLVLAANSAVAKEEEPPFFNATYKLFSSGLEIAQMERTLHKQGEDGYIYSSITDTIGLVAMFHKDHIVEESHWKIVDNHIRPLHYTYIRNGGKKTRRINIDFDWDRKLISNIVNERHQQMPLQTGILDKLLYQYALMRDLRNNQAEIAYELTDGGKMKKYNFAKMEDEIVQTPLGPLPTVKLQKIGQDDKSKLIFWSAPSLKYLPVKVESTDEDGHTTTAIIQTLTWL